MQEFYTFAGAHPILVFLLASMLVSAIIRLVPWSKRRDPEDDE